MHIVQIDSQTGEQTILELSEEEAAQMEAQDIANAWARVRKERNRRLVASDWSQLPDAQAAMSDERKAAWVTYRQALRDITITSADPVDVVWPVQPV